MMQELARAATATNSEIVPYASTSIMVMYAQQCIKATEVYQRFVKAFPGADKWAHRAIAATGTLIAALGIGYTFDYDVAKGGTLTVALPTLAVLLHGAKDFVVVYLGQQFAYDATRRGDMGPPKSEQAARAAETRVDNKEAGQ